MSNRLESLNNRDPNVAALNEKFGKRPGDYMTDPGWFRFNHFTKKVDLWNPKTKKWNRVTVGDVFDFDEEGNVVCVNR